MLLDDLEITKDLKVDIEYNQNRLKNAIRNHQSILSKLRADPENTDLQKELNKAEEDIVFIGLEQKGILERLRVEYKNHQKTLKSNIIKNGIEDRKFNLSNALNRARKQNISVRTSPSSYSDDSTEASSSFSSPEHVSNPTEPHDVSQPEFLSYFNLATHEVFREMQNKRVERKRRSTANPHFLYGNKGWDLAPKRRRTHYLVSTFSPPNTRQSVKKKNERISPPTFHPVLNEINTEEMKVEENKSSFALFPSIPNLPSGLTIERVSPNISPDTKLCIICKQTGELFTCDECLNGFHLNCHDRPLSQTPKQCPNCYGKESRSVGPLTVPTGMSISCVDVAQVSEQNRNLTTELNQLQEHHSELTISLNDERHKQEQLLMNHESTEGKIKQILTFIESMKNPNADNVKS